MARDRRGERRRDKLVRRQHVVSRFYLSGFANPAGLLQRVGLPGDRSHPVSVNDASVVKDFYTVTLPDGSATDLFERLFGEVEQPAATVLRDVRDGAWPLGPAPKATLAGWIALQHLRSQSIRRTQTEIRAQTIRLVVGATGKEALRRHIEAAEGSPVDDSRLSDEWADLTKPGGPTLSPDPDEHMRAVVDLLEPTTMMLASMQWSLSRFDDDPLITSDHPVVLLPRPDHPRWSGIGIANAGGFAVPLHRRLGLVIGASPDLPDMRVTGTEPLADVLNAGVGHNARLCLFHHPDDASVVAGLSLAGPREAEMGPPNDDRFIREEGLFSGLDPEQLSALASPFNGDASGFGLDDLPWPIPGRVRRPTGGGAAHGPA